MAKEIERKFLVDKLGILGIIKDAERKEISQTYLEVGETERRIRKKRNQKGEQFFLTVKRGQGLVREEAEVQIGRGEYEALLRQKVGTTISKTRYEVGLDNGLIAEVDVYHGMLNPLAVVEVEFESAELAQSFVPPKWFGAEITEDKRFKNQKLAFANLPPEKDREM